MLLKDTEYYTLKPNTYSRVSEVTMSRTGALHLASGLGGMISKEDVKSAVEQYVYIRDNKHRSVPTFQFILLLVSFIRLIDIDRAR